MHIPASGVTSDEFETRREPEKTLALLAGRQGLCQEGNLAAILSSIVTRKKADSSRATGGRRGRTTSRSTGEGLASPRNGPPTLLRLLRIPRKSSEDSGESSEEFEMRREPRRRPGGEADHE